MKPRRLAFVTEPQREEEEAKAKLYPFHVDYSSMRPKRAPVQLTEVEVETQPIASEEPSSEENYSLSFQSYESFQEQPVEEDADPLLESVYSLQPFPLPTTGESSLSSSQLRKQNEKMVHLKEQYRRIAGRYRHNLSILQRQRQQLSMLRGLKQKALDAEYDYSLSEEYARKREESQQVQESINKAARVIKMHKYSRLRQLKLFDDPDSPSCVLSSSRLLDSRAAVMVSLLAKREEVLCKRRQVDRYEEYLDALGRKEGQYRKLMDMYDGMIAKGSSEGMEKRVQFLKEEIELKKAEAQAREIGENLKIIALQNEISAIEIRIGECERKNSQEKMMISQLKGSPARVKIDTFVRKKISSQLITKAKLSQDILPFKATPKAKTKLLSQPLTPSSMPPLFKPTRHRYRQHTTHH